MSTTVYPNVDDNGATHSLIRDNGVTFYRRTAGGNKGLDLAVRSAFYARADFAEALKKYKDRYPKMCEAFR